MASEVRAGQDAAHLGSAIVERSRQVWLVLAICLFAFVALCVLTSYGVAAFLGSVTVAKTASLEPYTGLKLAVLRHGTINPEQISGPTTLQEGDTVISDENGRGFIRLFDESTLSFSFSTQLTLDTLHTNEFFGHAQDIKIKLDRGSILVARSPIEESSSQYIVATDQAETAVDPSSKVHFTIDEGDSRLTQVVVDKGHATFRSQGQRIELGPQQMAWVSQIDGPQGPITAETDLVENGNFVDGPTSSGETVAEGGLGVAGWLPISDEGSPPIPAGSVTITDELNLRVARILYSGSRDQLPRVGFKQDINKSVEFYNTIELSATLKVVSQQGPTQGPVGDSFPLTVRVLYHDSEGQLHEWKRSFYIGTNPEDLSDTTRVRVPIGKWETTGEISDLRQSLAVAQGAQELAQLNSDLFLLKSQARNPDVAVINSIEIYGTGAGFESGITDISLLAR